MAGGAPSPPHASQAPMRVEGEAGVRPPCASQTPTQGQPGSGLPTRHTPPGLGLGLGLDSDRGCRTGGHAEARGCCLFNTTSRVGKVSKLTRDIGLCWLDWPSIAALPEFSKQKVCVIDRELHAHSLVQLGFYGRNRDGRIRARAS